MLKTDMPKAIETIKAVETRYGVVEVVWTIFIVNFLSYYGKLILWEGTIKEEWFWLKF